MHPRITVHDAVFTAAAPLDTVLAGLARGGATRFGAGRLRIVDDDGAAAVAAAPAVLTHVVHGPLFDLGDPSSWQEAASRAIDTLDRAAELGAGCVYGTTGPALRFTWEAAAESFAVAAEPVARHARACGVPFLVEPTNMLFTRFGFVHTLRDTADVARAAGLGVCLDVQHCWAERGLGETIAAAMPAIGLVQLSDQLLDRREPYRAVPGDGVIPLRRILADVLEAGYGGLFDLELYPEPGVDPANTIIRAAERTGELLDEAGG
jgi:sugar phosphate isomerase/epimerase